MTSYIMDQEVRLSDGAAAYIATGTGQVSASNASVYCGPGRLPESAAVEVLVTALDTADGNETYVLQLALTNDAYTTEVLTGSLTVTATGRYLIPFTNWIGSGRYDEFQIRHTLNGTTPSITYRARFVSKV